MVGPIPKPTRKLICSNCGLSNEKIKAQYQACRNCNAPLFKLVNGLPVYFGPIQPRTAPPVVSPALALQRAKEKTEAQRARSKREKKWAAFRKKWLKAHEPEIGEYYRCWICHQLIVGETMTLDHIIPRSRAPERVFDSTNVAPAHYVCNTQKGSRVLAA